MKKKLVFLVNHLSSSSCFLNHRYYYYYYSFLTPTTPTSLQSDLLNLSNPKPYFGIGGIAVAFSSSTTTTTKTTSARKPVTTYLMERLGFSEEQSLATSKKLIHLREDPRVHQVNDLISIDNADNVITYLQEECGLDLSQVNKLITKYPLILCINVDKTLKPKIKLLQDLGFSTSDLAQINPLFYFRYDLSPAIQALRDLMGSDEGVVGVFKRLTWGTAANINDILIPNVNMLENEFGIPRYKLIKFLTKSPQPLLNKTELLREVLVRMEGKLGITRDCTEFLRAIHVFSGLSDDSINSKCQVYKSFGWSQSDIIALIRKHPYCLAFSEATMKNKLKFYMNELGYEPGYMISQPALITYSLESRVVPRHRVLSILKEKGLIKADCQLYTAVKLTEDRFLTRFIFPYENVVPNLREVFVNGSACGEAMPYGKTSEDETDQ